MKKIPKLDQSKFWKPKVKENPESRQYVKMTQHIEGHNDMSNG